jgi:hypothetical protein
MKLALSFTLHGWPTALKFCALGHSAAGGTGLQGAGGKAGQGVEAGRAWGKQPITNPS